MRRSPDTNPKPGHNSNPSIGASGRVVRPSPEIRHPPHQHSSDSSNSWFKTLFPRHPLFPWRPWRFGVSDEISPEHPPRVTSLALEEKTADERCFMRIHEAGFAEDFTRIVPSGLFHQPLQINVYLRSSVDVSLFEPAFFPPAGVSPWDMFDKMPGEAQVMMAGCGFGSAGLGFTGSSRLDGARRWRASAAV